MTLQSTEVPVLPYGRQCLDETDIAAVVEVLRGDWLTTGPAVPAFEEALASAVDAPHAIACSSGTAALHLAVLAAGLGPGDTVVVPSVTFLATANCNRYVGAEVVFADVDPDSGLMGPEHLEAALARAAGQRVKAAFVVHLNGQCADLTKIRAVADARDLVLIEDASHALGSVFHPAHAEAEKVGGCTYSDMTTFSFHPVKTITAGEAGAVTTRDEDFCRRLGQLRNHGITREATAFESPTLGYGADRDPNPWYYEMPELGFNYRLSDIHSALGHSQLGKLEGFSARRRALAGCYDDLLEPLAPVVRPIAREPNCDPVWHLYVVHIDFARAGVSRATLMRLLGDAGVGTQVHYMPLHLQPYYRRRYGALDLPGAQSYYDRCLTLPLFPAMTDADVERVVDTLAKCLT